MDASVHESDGWDNLEDADVLPDPESKAQTNLEDVDDEVDADDGHATQVIPRTPCSSHTEQGGESAARSHTYQLP